MTTAHPYKSAPKSSFWSRAVAADWSPAEVVQVPGSRKILICKGDRVVSAGSCFASNIIPYLETAGLTYLRTETTHPAFQALEPEPLGYAKFSAAYGNIYTARQLLQLLKRSLKTFSPVEDRWPLGDDIVDPLRPGLQYRARSDREFDLLTAQHLRKTYEAFESADVFVFTLGLTEGWVSRLDGTVFPACPGTVAGSFDPERHEFKNFSVSEVVADLDEFISLLRRINPDVSLIITVSPVPLVATATGSHVLSASVYSKSVLRVAAGEITKHHPDVTYFPAYEIVTGPQAPENFFETDRRNVSEAGIEAVMRAMLAHCEVEAGDDAELPIAPPSDHPRRSDGGIASKMSQLIVAAQCEEALADSPSPSAWASAIGRDLDALVDEQNRAVELALATERVKTENATLRAECSVLRSVLANERAARDAELRRAMIERDAVAAQSARWFEAVIAFTADHHPPMRAPHRQHSWWRYVARRFGGRRARLSPMALAARARDAQQWELAVRYYRDALDLEPSESGIWLQCGHALRAAGKVSEAATAYRRALDLDAENAEIRQKLEDVLKLRQSNESADSLAGRNSGAGVGVT